MQNAVGTMSDQSYLRSGAGIIALEAYHAGAVRMLLLQEGNTVVPPFSASLAQVTNVRCVTTLPKMCPSLASSDWMNLRCTSSGLAERIGRMRPVSHAVWQFAAVCRRKSGPCPISCRGRFKTSPLPYPEPKNSRTADRNGTPTPLDTLRPICLVHAWLECAHRRLRR